MLQTLRQLRQEVRREFFFGGAPQRSRPRQHRKPSVFPPGFFVMSVLRVDRSPGGNTVGLCLRASLEVPWTDWEHVIEQRQHVGWAVRCWRPSATRGEELVRAGGVDSQGLD